MGLPVCVLFDGSVKLKYAGLHEHGVMYYSFLLVEMGFYRRKSVLQGDPADRFIDNLWVNSAFLPVLYAAGDGL